MTERIDSTRPNDRTGLCSLTEPRAIQSGSLATSKEQQKQLSFTVGDNWPDTIPVTDREIEVIETYMSDVLDVILAQCKLGR